jgi:hypothetical protein
MVARLSIHDPDDCLVDERSLAPEQLGIVARCNVGRWDQADGLLAWYYVEEDIAGEAVRGYIGSLQEYRAHNESTSERVLAYGSHEENR